MSDPFDTVLGAQRGVDPTDEAVRDEERNRKETAQLTVSLISAARRIAVADIPGDWDRIVLTCETVSLDLDPDSLTAEQRQHVLEEWRETLGEKPRVTSA